MTSKPVSYEFDSGAEAPLERSGWFEPFVRRLAGDGAVNLAKAKAEVQAILRAAGGSLPPARALSDALAAASVPSVAAGRTGNRILAEIDQDGFAFAVDPIDEPFFNRRTRRVPRQQNEIEIVLIDGHVCVRKRIRGFRVGARRWGDRPVPARERARRSLWVALGYFLYSEAAALLRLHDLPYVPKVRAIDIYSRTLCVDYIPGENLRNLAARSGAAVHDSDIKNDAELGRLSAEELERREVELLDRLEVGDFRREIAEMAREINARGVVPLDIKLGNFLRGASTGRLYWLDFEICRLRSQPRFDEDLAVQRATLERLFQLAERGHTVV